MLVFASYATSTLLLILGCPFASDDGVRALALAVDSCGLGRVGEVVRRLALHAVQRPSDAGEFDRVAC